MAKSQSNRRVTRRKFLEIAEGVGVAALAAPLLAACAPAAQRTPVAAEPTQAGAVKAPAAEAPAAVGRLVAELRA